MLEAPYKLEAPYMLEADFRIAFMRFQDMGYPENTYGASPCHCLALEKYDWWKSSGNYNDSGTRRLQGVSRADLGSWQNRVISLEVSSKRNIGRIANDW